MQNNLIDKKIVDQKLEACGIRDMEDATIRDIVKVVNMVEAESGEKFIRMEMGVPALPPLKSVLMPRSRRYVPAALNSTRCSKDTRSSRKKAPSS